MIFSVSNDGVWWTLDFGSDSVTIAVNDLDQSITISSQEKPLAAWQLLLSQRQVFLNNHLARVPITPIQEGTMEMRDEVLSSMGAQDLDTSRYQVSDLEDIEFNRENLQLDLDAVFRPSIDTPFSPTTFVDILIGDGSVENPIVLDEKEDKENDPPPTTPESVRPTEPPRLQRSPAFGAKMENVPDYVLRNLFQKILPCLWCKVPYNKRVSFHHNVFQKLVRHVWDKNCINCCSFTISSSWFLHKSSKSKSGTT